MVTCNTDEDRRRLFATLSVVLVCLAGIPVWLKTTEIHRPALPTDGIRLLEKKLDSGYFRIPLHYTIWIFGSTSDIHTNELKELVNLQLAPTSDKIKKEVRIEVIVVEKGRCSALKTNSDGELWADNHTCVFSYEKVIRDLQKTSLNELDFRLGKSVQSTPGTYHLFVFPPESSETNKVIGAFRHSWMFPTSTKNLAKEAKYFLNHLFDRSQNSILNTENELIRAASDLLLSFTLCNSDVSKGYWIWDFLQFQSDWLISSLQQLDPVFHVRVESQVIYDCELTIQPQWSSEESSFVVKKEELKLFVNHEWDVDPTGTVNIKTEPNSSLSTVPHVLHFVVYIPPANFSPMVIKSDETQAHAFWLPSWGGVIILNKDYPSWGSQQKQRKLLEEEYRFVAENTMSLLRSLVGVEEQSQNTFNDVVLYSEHQGFTSHEIDLLVCAKLKQSIQSAIQILSSFIRLVQSISNLEVPDEIQQQIQGSVKSLELLCDKLQEQDLLSARELSRKAIELAEESFSHPAIQSIENFPDEHKLGIYAPFFLPVVMTTLLTCWQTIIRSFLKKL